MSSISTLGRWSAQGTTVSAVEAAIGDLRRQEERAAVRTTVVTLVAVAEEAQCEELLAVVEELGGVHPTHAILVVAGDRDGDHRVDADVRVHVLERGERAFSFEDIVLHIDGPGVDHLDSVVEPFTLPDLPVVLWVPARLPAVSDPLLATAERIVVDLKELGDGAAFADLATLTRRFPVADLSWVRLTPWRELLAGLFEGSRFRPFLDDVRSVRVAGKPGPRQLLAGWVASRLDLPRSRVHVTDARHVTIELVAEHEGRRGEFVVTRPTDDRMVEASATVEGGPAHRRALRLRPRSQARVLGQALTMQGRDHVYEQALAAAIELH